MSKKFKTHMIKYADTESFTTMCGIDDGCSEDFWLDETTLIEFGNISKCTCKKCIAIYNKRLEQHENEKSI